MEDHGKVCCEPFPDHKLKFVKVIPVSESVIAQAKKLNIRIKQDEFICGDCTQKIHIKVSKMVEKAKKSASKQPAAELMEAEPMDLDEDVKVNVQDVNLDDAIGAATESEPSETDPDEGFDPKEIDMEELRKCVNNLVDLLQMDKIDFNKRISTKKQAEIMKQLTTRLTKTLFKRVEKNYDLAHDGEQIIYQLKEKFEQTTSYNMKIHILSIFPKQWSFSKFHGVLGDNVTKHMVYKTKRLVKENGILCDNTKKIGSKSIDQNTVDKVIKFYREDISRDCPGMREFARIGEDGKRQKVQRKLIMMDLKEAYVMFKAENPDHAIGFSKFASLRPGECVLAGSTHGIHRVCVCLYHQNVKLTFDSLKSHFDLGTFDERNITTYREMMGILLCDPPTPKCRLNECVKCPGINGQGREDSGLSGYLFGIIDEAIYDTIYLKQWVKFKCN